MEPACHHVQSLPATVPDPLRSRLGMPAKTNFHWLNHHLCHSGSAYLVSPFPEAAILTIDGIGEFATTHAAVGTGNKIDDLGEIHYPNFPGFREFRRTQDPKFLAVKPH
jgi:carbamoyltransferase